VVVVVELMRRVRQVLVVRVEEELVKQQTERQRLVEGQTQVAEEVVLEHFPAVTMVVLAVQVSSSWRSLHHNSLQLQQVQTT
jgi:hypothetical protein